MQLQDETAQKEAEASQEKVAERASELESELARLRQEIEALNRSQP